jgi:rubrerythrin
METFESSERGLRATGASTGERDVVAWIDRHRREEGALLERYEIVAQQAPSEAVRYLLSLILEDERRHHRVLGEIAHAIAWGGVAAAVPAVPRMVEGGGTDELLAQTREMLASEKKDRRELRRLRRRLGAYSGTMWPLLIELMQLDTDKHMRILRYVIRHRPG